MFKNCSSLLNININNFNTENLKEINYMFYGCSSLKSLDLSSFNIENQIKMEYIFYHCNKLEYLDISSIKNISGANNTLFSEDIDTKGVIKVHTNISDIIKDQIPLNWTIEVVE